MKRIICHLLNFGFPTFLTKAVRLEPKSHGAVCDDGELVQYTTCIHGYEVLCIGGHAVIDIQFGGVQTQRPLWVIIESMGRAMTVVVGISGKLLEGHLNLVVPFGFEGVGVVFASIEPAFPIVIWARGFAASVVEINHVISRDGTRTGVHVHVVLCHRRHGKAYHHQQQQAGFQLVELSFLVVILLHFTSKIFIVYTYFVFFSCCTLINGRGTRDCETRVPFSRNDGGTRDCGA